MFDHCLYFNTTALARAVEREWTATYAPFGLTPPQGFVLRVVLKQPGVLNRELADTLGIARPTATRLVDGLIASGASAQEAERFAGALCDRIGQLVDAASGTPSLRAIS